MIKQASLKKKNLVKGLKALNNVSWKIVKRNLETGEFEAFFSLKIIFLISKMASRLHRFLKFGFLSLLRSKVQDIKIYAFQKNFKKCAYKSDKVSSSSSEDDHYIKQEITTFRCRNEEKLNRGHSLMPLNNYELLKISN